MTILDDDPLWWWPEPGTEYEHEFAEETLAVVLRVARYAETVLYSHPNLALVADDIESWLTDYTFTVRKNIDAGTFYVNQPILTSWCRVLYASLKKASEWYLSNNRPAGLPQGEVWQLATQTKSTEQPFSPHVDDGATVGDYGHALWSSAEPVDPAKHLMALETMRETIERLSGEPCNLEWDDALVELDRLAGDSKPGQCAEFGCLYPPLSGKKGSMCQYHTKLAWYENNTDTCTVDGCDAKVKANGLCSRHWNQERKRNAPPCTEPDCERPQHARGLCTTHHRRQLASGEIRRAKRPDGQARYLEVCSVDGCEGKVVGKGMCNLHYWRTRKGYPLDGKPQAPPRACEVEGCGKPHDARGMCSTHYSRWRAGKLEDPPGESEAPR